MSTETLPTSIHGSPEVMPGTHVVSKGSIKNVSDHSGAFLYNPETAPNRIEWLDNPDHSTEAPSASREKVDSIFKERGSGLAENNIAIARNYSQESEMALLDERHEDSKQQLTEYFEDLDEVELNMEKELNENPDFEWLTQENATETPEATDVLSTTESTLPPEEQYATHKEELARLVELYIERNNEAISDKESDDSSFHYEKVESLADLQHIIDDQMVQCTLAKKLMENQDNLEQYAAEVKKVYPNTSIDTGEESAWQQNSSEITVKADQNGVLTISITHLNNPYEHADPSSYQTVQGNLTKRTQIIAQ